jgi:hypothetical protein
MAQPQLAAQAVQAFRTLRRWPRLKIHVPVTVVVRKQEKTVFVQARGQDLNEGGIGVFVGTELRIGELVEISFTPPYQGNPMTARMEFITETKEDQKKVEIIRSVLRTMKIE